MLAVASNLCKSANVSFSVEASDQVQVDPFTSNLCKAANVSFSVEASDQVQVDPFTSVKFRQ